MHEGHRNRVKNRFLKEGLESFADHEVLELLLYFSIPRGDTNPVAHRLIERFQNLKSVFDADFSELKAVNGVGDN